MNEHVRNLLQYEALTMLADGCDHPFCPVHGVYVRGRDALVNAMILPLDDMIEGRESLEKAAPRGIDRLLDKWARFRAEFKSE